MTVRDAESAQEELSQDYPDAKITVVSSDEVIAELPDGGAVVMVGPGGSVPHFHLKTAEVYQVTQGRLAVIEAGNVVVLEPGTDREGVRLMPYRVHHARSLGLAWAKFTVLSVPPWTPKDHFIA